LEATTRVTGNKEKLEEVVRTGNIYRGNITKDRARVMMANIGEGASNGPGSQYVENQASGDADVIMGNITDPNVVNQFFSKR
jgi:hypothetical protein